MIIPPPLKSGDKIGIISTARKISNADMQPAIEAITGWRMQAEIGDSIGAEYFQFAGTDDVRRENLQQMLDDESIKTILFARGGYGTVRIIDDLDWRKFLKNPKWLCGFSDITIIHSHLLAVYDCASIHSLMGINFKDATQESIQTLHRVLTGGKPAYKIAAHILNKTGRASGILCGGNLSILISLNGTVSDIDTQGKILFIEDIDEHLYHIDRMVLSLKRSGKLDRLAGLVVGYFSDMKDKDAGNPFGKTAYEIIAAHTAEYDYPVSFGFPAGHENDNRALVMGVKWNLVSGAETELQMV